MMNRIDLKLESAAKAVEIGRIWVDVLPQSKPRGVIDAEVEMISARRQLM